MCDNCEREFEDKVVDDHTIAGMALTLLGVLIEDYCEQGYCDPTMYKALTLAERLAKKLDEPELADRMALAKIFAGETVESLIERTGMEMPEGWRA